MARRRKRKLNVAVALIIAAVVVLPIGGYISYRTFLSYHRSKYAEKFALAQQQAEQGNVKDAAGNFNRAIAWADYKKDVEAGAQYRMAVADFMMDLYKTDKSLTEESRRQILGGVVGRLAEAASMKEDDPQVLRKYAQLRWDTLNLLSKNDDLITACEAYLKVKEDDAEVLRWVAQAHAEMAYLQPEHVEPALKAFEKAAQLDGRNVNNFVLWLALLEQQHRTADIEKVVTQAVAANPDSPRLQVRWARLLLEDKHNASGASQHFAAALAIPNKSVEDWQDIGDYYLLRIQDTRPGGAVVTIKDSDPNKCLEAYAQSIQTLPARADAYLKLSQLNMYMAHLDRCDEVLHTGLKAFEAMRGDVPLGQMEPREKMKYLSGVVQLRSALVTVIFGRRGEYGSNWPEHLAEARGHVEWVCKQMEEARNTNSYIPYKLKGELALAEANGDNSKLIKAAELLRKAYELQMSGQQAALDLETVYYLTNVYTMLNQYGAARDLITKLLERNPSNVEFLMRAARLDVLFGQFGQAKPVLQRLRSLDAQLSEEQRFELSRLDRQMAEGINGKVENVSIPQHITAAEIPYLLADARMMDSQGQHDQSGSVCDAILSQYPDNEEVRLQRTEIYAEQSKLQEAHQCVTEGLKLNPQSVALKYQMAMLDANTPDDRSKLRLEYITHAFQGAEMELMLAGYYQNEVEDANASISHLEKAAQLDPNSLAILKLLFTSYMAQHDTSKMEGIIEKVKAFGPDQATTLQTGLLLDQAAQSKDPNAAREKVNQAVAMMKDLLSRREAFSEGHAMLGQLYLQTNKFDDARSEFQRSYDLNPSWASAIIGLAKVSAIQGRQDEFEKWILLAFRQAPNDRFVRSNYLNIQEKNATTPADIDKLITYCEGLSVGGADADHWLRMARLYLKATPPRTERAGRIFEGLFQATAGKERSLQYLGMYLQYLRKRDSRIRPRRY